MESQDTQVFWEPSPRLFTEYSDIEKIGGGDFGTVYSAVYLPDGHYYAIKQLRQTPESKSQLQQHLQEVYALAGVQSPHVLRYYDSWLENHDVALRTELLTPLRQVLPYPLGVEADVWEFVMQMALALHEIHSGGIAHLDIKPDNILAVQSGGRWHFKLADFGLARTINTANGAFDGLNDDEGDRRYLCPYLLSGALPLKLAAADIFSLGATICEVIGGSPIAIANRDIGSALTTAVPLPQVHRLVAAMTCEDPCRRPDAFEVLQMAHSWFTLQVEGGDEIAELRDELSRLQRRVDSQKQVTHHLTAGINIHVQRI